MASLRAWGQGSGAPAYRQLVQRPALNRLGESSKACVSNLVVVEKKFMRMAHQTKGMSPQESAHANKVSGHGDEAVGRQHTVNPFPTPGISSRAQSTRPDLRPAAAPRPLGLRGRPRAR